MSWVLSAFADEAGESSEQQIISLQRDDYHFIDLRGVDGYNISQLPLDAAKAIKKKLDNAAIDTHMFGSPIGKIDIGDDMQIDLDKLTHLGEMAKVFNCKAVRIFSYFNKAGVPMAQWQAQSIDRLKRLTDLADRLDLDLYHENESDIFGDRCEQVLQIAEQCRDGKRFNLIFDFDNFNRSGDDVWDNWLKLKESTDAFHLKDSTGEHMHVPIAQGTGKAREILSAALASGWEGPLTLEPHLSHSAAVIATGVSGQANQSLKDMTTQECFHIGAQAARQLLDEIGAIVQ